MKGLGDKRINIVVQGSAAGMFAGIFCVYTTQTLRRGSIGLVYPRRYETSSVGQSAGLLIPRSSVRFRQTTQRNPRELKSTWALAEMISLIPTVFNLVIAS